MYHLFDATDVEPRIRRLICTQCWRRPPGSGALSPAIARPCQDTCPIFRLLPALVRRAELMDPSIGCPAHALREQIDAVREQSDALDAKTLEQYGGKVSHIIAEMVETAG